CTSRLVCGLLVSSRPRRYPCLLSVTPPCLDRRIPTVSDPPSWPARPDSWERLTPGSRCGAPGDRSPLRSSSGQGLRITIGYSGNLGGLYVFVLYSIAGLE